MSEPRIEEALEMARCAEINLDNLQGMVPLLAGHPFFKIVLMQVRTTIAHLEGDEVAEGS